MGETYEWTAWVSTCGVVSIAITATYLRLLREVSDTGAFPWSELVAQLALIAGAAVGMEFYAVTRTSTCGTTRCGPCR